MIDTEAKDTIYKALVRAQKEFGPALKSSNNPHFRSKYADLAACVEAVIDGLNNNGIALMQHIHEVDSGVCVETVFLHESGQFINCGKLRMPVVKNDAQGVGSALTYARRYSLLAASGIAPEDDDGNTASGLEQTLPKVSKYEPAEKKTETVVKSDTKKARVTYYNVETLTGEQLTIAEHYLLANAAKRISQTMWKSPIRLEKLTSCIDEVYNEAS